MNIEQWVESLNLTRKGILIEDVNSYCISFVNQSLVFNKSTWEFYKHLQLATYCEHKVEGKNIKERFFFKLDPGFFCFSIGIAKNRLNVSETFITKLRQGLQFSPFEIEPPEFPIFFRESFEKLVTHSKVLKKYRLGVVTGTLALDYLTDYFCLCDKEQFQSKLLSLI